MAVLRNAVKVHASRPDVYKAITDLSEMAAWHVGSVSGAMAPGAVLHLASRPDLKFAWRTDTMEPDTSLVQTCVEGPGSSVGKTLRFDLADADGGRTVVSLSDSGWSDDDPHLPFCNAHWGEVLFRLKTYVEKV